MIGSAVGGNAGTGAAVGGAVGAIAGNLWDELARRLQLAPGLKAELEACAAAA